MGLLFVWWLAIVYNLLLILYIVGDILRNVNVFCRIDRFLLKRMLSFSGWNFIGASSAILRDQGVNIAINLFCGPTVNAARGMAVQVNHAINSFAQNFMTALNPQITKSFAVGDSKYMFTLIFRGQDYLFICYYFCHYQYS